MHLTPAQLAAQYAKVGQKPPPLEPYQRRALATPAPPSSPHSPAGEAPKSPGIVLKRGPGLNALEERFARRLESLRLSGHLLAWWPHPFSLRLGPRRFYLPDFLIQYPPSRPRPLLLIETKATWANGQAGIKDDSREKFKNAAELYPCFDFLLLREQGGEWIPVYRSEGAEDL